jgi:membrane protein DedA with SNARE-associated domain
MSRAETQGPGAPDATDSGSTIAPAWRRLALGVVVLRFAVPLAAIPLIPYLLVNDVSLLVFLRPQKEFLLVGGGQTRYLGEPGFAALLLAYLPLGVLAVSAFFLVGRAYRSALRDGSGPTWLTRAIPPKQLELSQRVLARRGPTIAIIGRIAAMPPTVLGAAAGVSDVSLRRYLLADALGALLSFGLVVGIGYGLGRAYGEGGFWVTAAGVALFVLMLLLVTRWIQREGERQAEEERTQEGAATDGPDDPADADVS